ncbi:MAG: S8 family peptidase [Burkholderiaceae bacterium]
MKQRTWQKGLSALAALILAACGGGQSGESASTRSQPLAASEARLVDQMEPSEATGKRSFTNRAYIVRMADQPVTAYDGSIKEYTATKPGKGRKIDPNSGPVVAYLGYLVARQDAALASVGGGKKLYNYGYVFNGFAAELTEAQAAKLAAAPGVIGVVKDEARQLDTATTPGFLGLAGDTGVWKSATGEGIVVGIVDGGIWPEHPSVSDRTGTNGNGTQDGKLDYKQLPGWHGKCVPGERFTGTDCNQKLIGARYYNAGFGGNAGIDELMPWEFNSPRDYGGHGTHTATTAAGNAGVAPTGEAAVFGAISGIAPRARIAAYKVCWAITAGGSCFTSDSVAAIDQAVADGVDVINFSISGSTTNFLDPVEVAFLFAADAGVFVAVSAGNSGPATSTVAHPGPWLTTVAAGTHNRDGQGSVTLGNGITYSGASVAAAVGPAPLIDSTAAALTGADPTAVRLCFPADDNGGTAVLDPAKVAGKIVVCDRGVNARTNKSLAVKEAGGIGMILVNTSPNSLNADLHFVPTVHLQSTDRAAVKAYAAQASPTAKINTSMIILTAQAPFTASFSSRGPLRAGGGDLLKPDLIAPGQDILAGVAPPGNHGRLFDVYSGTSMSSPHVAGLGALMKELRPTWSPMAIKSALMTTAYDVLDGPNTDPLVIFRQGAGHVQPPRMNDPGLVFDHGFNDWLQFLCGTGQLTGGTCTAVGRTDPSDLNVASIAIGDLAGTQTVKRRVTNVGGSAATYGASVSGMAGFAVEVLPSSLTVPAGQTKEFMVRFTRTSAATSVYTGGQLTWRAGAKTVRVPLVVRPVALAAPAEVNASPGTASFDYNVTFGYNGAFTAAPRGLIVAALTSGIVSDDPDDSTCSLTSKNAVLVPVTISAGTTYARFSLFDADVKPGSDIDMCVFQGTTQVGGSGSGTSAEEVSLVNPTPGAYTVVVQGWGVVGSSPFTLHTWLLGSTAAGNMTVSAPGVATLGAIGKVTLGFIGLVPATRYLGAVAYGGTTGLPNPTIVRVDTP